jgi:hypothetical protein
MPPTTVECPECQATLKLPPTATPGKKIRCPKCKVPFTVPDPEEEAITTSPRRKPARPAPTDDDTDDDESPSPRKPVQKRRDEEEEDEEEDRRPVRKAARQVDEEEEEEEDQPPRNAGRKRGAIAEDDEEDEEDLPRRKKKKDKEKKGSPVLLWSLVIGGALILLGGGITLMLVLSGKNKEGGTSDQAANKDNQPQPKDAPKKDGQGDGKQTAWQPDAALLNQLDQEKTIQGFRIRPPQGYRFQEQQVQGSKIFMWLGPARPDGTLPTLTISMMTLSPQEASLPLEKTLEMYIAGMKLSLPTLTNAGAERGQINGLKFIQTKLTAKNPKLGKDLNGFSYLAQDGRTGIAINFLDYAPHHEKTLKLGETAARTFKKP